MYNILIIFSSLGNPSVAFFRIAYRESGLCPRVCDHGDVFSVESAQEHCASGPEWGCRIAVHVFEDDIAVYVGEQIIRPAQVPRSAEASPWIIFISVLFITAFSERSRMPDGRFRQLPRRKLRAWTRGWRVCRVPVPMSITLFPAISSWKNIPHHLGGGVVMPCAECHFGVYHDVKSGGRHILMERGVDHACVVDLYRPEIMFSHSAFQSSPSTSVDLMSKVTRNRESGECLSRNAVRDLCLRHGCRLSGR